MSSVEVVFRNTFSIKPKFETIAVFVFTMLSKVAPFEKGVQSIITSFHDGCQNSQWVQNDIVSS